MLFSYCHLGFFPLFSTSWLLFLLLIQLYLLFADEATKLIYKEGPDHEQQQQLLLRCLHTQLVATPESLCSPRTIGGASQRPFPTLPFLGCLGGTRRPANIYYNQYFGPFHLLCIILLVLNVKEARPVLQSSYKTRGIRNEEPYMSSTAYWDHKTMGVGAVFKSQRAL